MKSFIHSHFQSFPCTYPYLLSHIAVYLPVQDIIALSSTSSTFRNSLLSDDILWNELLSQYYPKQIKDIVSYDAITSSSTPRLLYHEFLKLSTVRIWNWNSLFSSPVFWAQVGFTLSQIFEDQRIFGVSFSSPSTNKELRKKDASSFDDWDDGHNLVFHLPENYKLFYQISDHTMGTWTLQCDTDDINSPNIELLCRLDGHPILPGFTYHEAHLIISYLCKKSSILLIDSSHLWPLFFPFIELSTHSLPDLKSLIHNLRTSSWKHLKLHYTKWKKLEAYIRSRCQRNSRDISSETSRGTSMLSKVCKLLTNELSK